MVLRAITDCIITINTVNGYNNEHFLVGRVQKIDFCSAVQDLSEDEPDISIADYFTGFTLMGRCVNCGGSACIEELDL